MTYEKKMYARYYSELGGAMLLYAAVLVCALKFGASMPAGGVKTAVMLSPMIPILLVAWAIARQFSRSDEYIRLQTLQNIAVSFVVTAAASLTYGFLENAGFPRLSMFLVWPFMAGVWSVLTMARGICAR